jgi:hypothetical protein
MAKPVRLLGLILLAGCQSASPPDAPRKAVAVIVEEEESWRELALPEHRSVIAETERLLADAVTAVRAGPFAKRVAAEGPLLSPAALPHAAPSPGSYRCRLVRIGTPGPRLPAYAATRPAFCFVGGEGEQLSLTLEVPGRRLGGYLWDTRENGRMVFLGTDFAPRAQSAGAYGEPAARNAAGLFQRIGDFRYRLLVRGEGAGSRLDVYDLTASPAQR